MAREAVREDAASGRQQGVDERHIKKEGSGGQAGPSPSQDIRYSDSQDVRYSQDASCSQGSQDVRYSQDGQDVRYCQDARYNPPPRGGAGGGRQQQKQHQGGGQLQAQDQGLGQGEAKRRSRGGKNRSKGEGKGEGNCENGGWTPKALQAAEGAEAEAGDEGAECGTAAPTGEGGAKSKRSGRSRGGRGGTVGGGGGGGGTGGGGGGNGGSKERSKRVGNGGGKGGAGGIPEGGEAEGDILGGGDGERQLGEVREPPASGISSKIRKFIQAYDETLDINHLVAAYDAFEGSHNEGNGVCDGHTLHLLLMSLTRVSQLSKAHKVIDMAVEHGVCLDVNSIVAIAMSVTQRSQSHKGLRYLRRLIYETLPAEFGEERQYFFFRHASFIFSELMAEADASFGRMENRESSTLVGSGHTELGIEMDWDKSSRHSYVLFNRLDEKGKQVYAPTVSTMGFMRTDVCLLSYDIGHPDMISRVPCDYDRVRDGAEVEVTASASQPNTLAPLTVRLLSPAKAPIEPGMVWRIDRLASRDQMRRMLQALRVVLASPEAGMDVQPAKELRELLLVPNEKTLTEVGKTELQYNTMDYNKHKMAGVEAFQRDARESYAHRLNKSQLDALTLATTRRLTLIQGPPGTGKTTTAVQIVSALVKYGLADLPILVTADSNTAVDNLVRGIAKDGLNVIRVGRPESIREDVKQYSLDSRYKELKKVQVICATCIGVSGSTLEKVRFSTVLIDECTQAAESAALVPLARGCQQAVLIGDQCQLPPTVLSDVAQNENLGESLFTRLVTQGVKPTMLDTQYRMNPLICEFASAAFYNGRLQNGVAHMSRKPPEGFPWPQRQMPVAFVNLERSEEKREGSSYINPAEAEKVLWALQEVSSKELNPEDIGIVTPYKGQVNYIKKLIRERPDLQRFRTGLEVESVDGFQGEEKEVIIFGAVRSNREGKVGFLSDWRRLNVMLTRARRGCIIIGSRSTLVSDPLWKEWLLWAAARGAICGEAAKGTWVPRYLVDDRDGMWTVKAQFDEAPVFVAAAPSSAAASPAPPEAEVLDSWEDLISPVGSPVGSPTHGSPTHGSPGGSPTQAKESTSAALADGLPEALFDGITVEEDGITIVPFSHS